MSGKIRSTSSNSERKHSSSDEDTVKITASRGKQSPPLNPKKSPSRSRKQRPRKYKSPSSSDEEAQERTPKWWKELYRDQRMDLKKTLERVLDCDITLYREIIIAWMRQIEAIFFVEYEEMEPEYWLISYDQDDRTAKVVNHAEANEVIHELTHSHELPKKLSNGKEIPKIKTFDQLMVLMAQFNPEYILELAAHTLTGRDFSRFKMSDYTELNESSAKKIREDLESLLESLQ